ncbi:MAG TPA: tryptophan 2,3-dioxygenase family protein [Ktedonobacterales bacterium]
MAIKPTSRSAGTGASTTYERYIRTGELLALQKTDAQRLHPDELVFQITHQTFELWWKLVTELMDRATASLVTDDFHEAERAVERAVAAQGVADIAMRQLELLPPVDFLVIRAGLEDGNGGDSPGFRGILRRAPALWDAFAAAMGRADVSLVDLYAAPRERPALYACAEALTDFDEHFSLFRAAHLKLAQRHLGLQSRGTGGTPMSALERTLLDMLFPELWQTRDALVARSQEAK